MKWELHHIKALIRGGQHRESNLVPALVGPHIKQTNLDKAFKKLVSRKRKKHLGIDGPKKKIPSRGFGKWKSNSVDVKDERI